MTRRILFALIMCVLILVSPVYAARSRKAPARQSESQKVIRVHAEGAAVIIEGRKNEARESARREMIRNAIDNAVGTYVNSVTQIENYQVVSDKLFTQSQGLVKAMDVQREWTDENSMYHIEAYCSVVEVILDERLGPAVIDALGNPRILILIDNPTVRNEVQKVFTDSGFMIINPEHAARLQNIDEEFARGINDPVKLRDAARNFRADVIITGESNSSTVMKQKVWGYTLYKVSSNVRLEAFLADTAQTIGSENFSWAPAKQKDGSLSYGEGAARGLTYCAKKAANSIVNKVAYGLTAGREGSRTGHVVKVIITDIDFGTARNLQDRLGSVPTVSSVNRRSYRNGSELELDVTLKGSADDLANAIFDMGIDITGTSAAQIEGRMK
ncbi:MAG: hypothetical protein IJQ77_01000 [Synergistaceae bacterium]|nr:hypothetical protein [Synergistaceae bacterium]MBQ3693152.1 hypothetical protein [Synergistaceae bacterium]MBR0249640.1 hypothetical protein [Synergistaceae bacterium]